MRGFAAAAQLIEDSLEHRRLGVQIAVQAVRGAFIHELPEQVRT
jgi:hypothetical protein